MDETFGEAGIRLISLDRSPRVGGMAIQDDGKILFVANTTTPPVGEGDYEYKSFVVRLNADGSLDHSFAVDGIVEIEYFDYGLMNDLVIKPDHRIVIAGESGDDVYDTDLRLQCFMPNSEFDPAFGFQGIELLSVPMTSLYGRAVEVDSHGNLVVAGSTYGSTTESSQYYAGLICRFQPDGSLDPSFDGDGYFIDYAVVGYSSLALQSDGKPIVGASYYTSALTRYGINGSLDLTFGERVYQAAS